MRLLFATLAIMTTANLSGCSQGTPGGPGTTDKKPAFGQADNTFNLTVPVLSSSLQQGESVEATMGITRAKNFDEDVAIQFANVPKGVTIDPASPVIKHGDLNAMISIKAGEESPAGEHVIKVTGHPEKGSDAQIKFKLSIAAKDTFKLSLPSSTTSLKQGETQTVSIFIKRDKSFDQDVALSFGDLPTGVTLEPAAPVIKSDEEKTQVTLTAAEDAALGNFATKVTGHPVKGDDASSAINFTVVKK